MINPTDRVKGFLPLASRPVPPAAEVVTTPNPQAGADAVSLGTRAPAPAPVVTETPRLQPRTPIAAPPVTLHDASDEDTAALLQHARLTFPDHPSLDSLTRRLNQAVPNVREAASGRLLDLITNPDVKAAATSLTRLADTLGFAQSFKKDAQKLLDQGGWAAVEQGELRSHRDHQPIAPIDRALASSDCERQSRLSPRQRQEANALMERFAAGNENPGLGSKSLNSHVRYLRGDSGVRLFYEMRDGAPRYLAIVDKGDENAAIAWLQANHP